MTGNGLCTICGAWIPCVYLVDGSERFDELRGTIVYDVKPNQVCDNCKENIIFFSVKTYTMDLSPVSKESIYIER